MHRESFGEYIVVASDPLNELDTILFSQTGTRITFNINLVCLVIPVCGEAERECNVCISAKVLTRIAARTRGSLLPKSAQTCRDAAAHAVNKRWRGIFDLSIMTCRESRNHIIMLKQSPLPYTSADRTNYPPPDRSII